MLKTKTQSSPQSGGLRPKLNIGFVQQHPYLSLLVAAALLRLIAALIVRQPGFVDAYYYYQIAANWQAGRGLTESTIWNYQAGGLFDPTIPGLLDHPAFTYWTPLASLLCIASFSLFGTSFWAASLPFMLCGMALPLVAYWLGRLIFGTEQRHYSWTMGLIMLFPGRYFLFWNTPDNFAPFALITMLALAAIYGGLYHDDRWLIAAGGLLGLAYLSRSDGILLTVTLVLSFGLQRWQGSEGGRRKAEDGDLRLEDSVLSPQSSVLSPRPRWVMLLTALGVALLVVAPWLWRNLIQFGAIFPANNLKVVWLRNYQDFFSYQLNLDANYYFSWGWGNILGSKLNTLAINSLLLTFQGLFLLGPLFLIGLWAVRRNRALGPFLIYSLVLLVVMTSVFTEIGSHGTIFHSAGGLLPFQAGIALAGLEWLGRGKARPRAASIMVLVALAVTVYFVVSYQLPEWDRDYAASQPLEKWFEGHAGPKDVIMVGEPLSFNYATGRPAISQASDGLEANLEALRRYRARWFVLGPERYGGLDDLYRAKSATGNRIELRLTAELDGGIQIYEVLLR